MVLYGSDNAQKAYADPIIQIKITDRTAINDSRRVILLTN